MSLGEELRFLPQTWFPGPGGYRSGSMVCAPLLVGMVLSSPLTLCQIAWFRVISSVRSASEKSIRDDSAAMGAEGPLVSVSDWLGTSAVYGAGSGRPWNALSIGMAAASNWVIGLIPVISSMVRSIETVL